MPISPSLLVMLGLIVFVMVGLVTNFGVKYERPPATTGANPNQKPRVKNAWILWCVLPFPLAVVAFYSHASSQPLARLGGVIFLVGVAASVVIAVIPLLRRRAAQPKS